MRWFWQKTPKQSPTESEEVKERVSEEVEESQGEKREALVRLEALEHILVLDELRRKGRGWNPR